MAASTCTAHPQPPVRMRAGDPFVLFILLVCTAGLALPIVWHYSPGHVRAVNRRNQARYEAALREHRARYGCTRRRRR